MGRTIPTVNQVLEENREQWRRFYRALRREDRELLDRLFDGAKYFTAACVYQINAAPSESIFLAMLLHLQKEIQELQIRLGVEEPTSPQTRPLLLRGGEQEPLLPGTSDLEA
jgi:hypothetical protein